MLSTTPSLEHTRGPSYARLVIFASFGAQMALVTPVAISLALRLDALAPADKEQYLGYITGAGSIVAMISGPLFGALSDRARGRLGRRRPFLVWGAAGGTAALLGLAAAPNVLLLGCAWVCMYLTWAVASTILNASIADRVAPAERGRIAGWGGFTAMLAPILGAGIASGLSGSSYLMFLVPGAVGVLGIFLFVLRIDEPDARDLPDSGPFRVRDIAATYVFSPRKHPDFGWNLFGRFLFVSGMTLSTAFVAYYLSQRLGHPVDSSQVKKALVLTGASGALVAMVGALGSGYVTDRLGRRLPLALVAACVFGLGAFCLAAAQELPMIVLGLALCNLGIGAFSAVDQAIALDLVPDRETQAARYMAIYGLSTSLAHSVAPFVAPALLAIAASGEKNYGLLYTAAGLLTIAGGIVLFRIQSIR